jgi:hypothetical protein
VPVTMQDVLRQLGRDEPDYAQAARLGPDARPHLRHLIQGSDLGLAAKAACLAGTMGGNESIPLVELAARHPDALVRVAAAAAARHLPHLPTSLATSFLEDADPGVRKWGLRTLQTTYAKGIKRQLEGIMKDDPDVGLREEARKVFDRLK